MSLELLTVKDLNALFGALGTALIFLQVLLSCTTSELAVQIMASVIASFNYLRGHKDGPISSQFSATC